MSASRRTDQCEDAHLLAAKNQPLLLWGNARLLLDLLLDPSDLNVDGGYRMFQDMRRISNGQVGPRTLSSGSISSSIFVTEGTRPKSQSHRDLSIHRERIAQMKCALSRPDVYYTTPTSLPVSVYMDERESERGAPRNSTPSASSTR